MAKVESSQGPTSKGLNEDIHECFGAAGACALLTLLLKVGIHVAQLGDYFHSYLVLKGVFAVKGLLQHRVQSIDKCPDGLCCKQVVRRMRVRIIPSLK